jgi:hypothetical protein
VHEKLSFNDPELADKSIAHVGNVAFAVIADGLFLARLGTDTLSGSRAELFLNVRTVDRSARGAEQWSRAASTRRKKWESTWGAAAHPCFRRLRRRGVHRIFAAADADAGASTPGYGRVPLSLLTGARREWLPIPAAPRAPSG